MLVLNLVHLVHMQVILIQVVPRALLSRRTHLVLNSLHLALLLGGGVLVLLVLGDEVVHGMLDYVNAHGNNAVACTCKKTQCR